MGRYAKLGTLVMRWTAVGFFVLALVFVPFGFAGGMYGPMMGSAAPEGATTGVFMHGSAAMLWGPVLLNVAMGTVLFALSKPVGSLLASGLDD